MNPLGSTSVPCAAAALVLLAACAESARRPSIVFVSLDTLGARNTSLHGYARDTTPELERLAEEGVVFERCLANAAYTTPSYASQLTGMSPLVFTARETADGGEGASADAEREDWCVPEAQLTLAEALHAAGYRTAAFVDNPLAGPHFGFAQGFERYDMEASEGGFPDPERGIRLLVPRVLEWLDGLDADEPFFVFVNALDVHAPYVPPPELADVFADDALARVQEELPVSTLDQVFGAIPAVAARALVPRDAPLPATLPGAALVQRYDACVRAVDATLGELLDALRARGVLDDALVVVSADHGESMGSADLKFGHVACLEETLHVPLVLKLPEGREAGRRVATTVQLLDLFPTLLELARVPVPPEVHGRSLVPLLSGAAAPAPFPSWAAHVGGYLSEVAVTDGEWRLVETRPADEPRPGLLLGHAHGRRWAAERYPELDGWIAGTRGAGDLRLAVERRDLVAEARAALAGPRYELYRVADDPHQLRDLAAEHPEEVARLAARLAEERRRARAARERLPAAADGARPPPPSLEDLRALGYAAGGD